MRVYDTGGGLMPRQRDAHHRVAHLDVNFWPAEDVLNPSNDFPFLNWISSGAVAIATDLEDGKGLAFSYKNKDGETETCGPRPGRAVTAPDAPPKQRPRAGGRTLTGWAKGCAVWCTTGDFS